MPVTEIPTEADWDDWPPEPPRWIGLDEEYARRQFFGKSFEEAVGMFRNSNVLERSEDLSNMPPVPFRYYLLAYVAHMQAGAPTSVDECLSDAASSFLRLIERKLEVERAWIEPIMEAIMPTAELVAKNQARYDASIEIYGDFLERLAHIKELRGA